MRQNSSIIYYLQLVKGNKCEYQSLENINDEYQAK